MAVRADGTSPAIHVTNTGASEALPTVRPDGTQLLYAWSSGGGSTELGYGHLSVTASTVTLTATGTAGTFAHHASFAFDNQTLTYDDAPGGTNGDVWSGTWTGAAITGQTPLTTTGADIGPAFGHDGSWIAFLSARSGAEGLLYVMHADGTDQHPVPLGASLIVGPPDAY